MLLTMFIAGHVAILEDAVRLLATEHGVELGAAVVRALIAGVKYPDLPCGRYVVAPSGRRQRQVFMSSQSPCSAVKLYKTLSPRYAYKEIYHSHNGSLAFMHAMARSSDDTVSGLLSAILRHLASYAALAMAGDDVAPTAARAGKPNAFWMGIVLHVIMDSYSPAHTIRDATARTVRARPHPRKEVDHEGEAEGRGDKLHVIRRIAEDMVARGVRLPGDASEFGRVLRSLEWNVTLPPLRAFKAFKMYAFDAECLARVAPWVRGLGGLGGAKQKKSGAHDIVNFQYYFDQGRLYHASRDRLSQVKRVPAMYKRMVSECVEVLAAYASFAARVATIPEAKRQEHARITREFARWMYSYAAGNTFRVAPEHLDEKTGLMYAAA